MKISAYAVCLLGFAGVSHASNSWNGALGVTQVLILQTTGDPVCQVSLAGGGQWAFEVDSPSQEKNVDLLRTALEKGYTANANYSGSPTQLSFTPIGGSLQTVNLANGWAIAP